MWADDGQEMMAFLGLPSAITTANHGIIEQRQSYEQVMRKLRKPRGLQEASKSYEDLRRSRFTNKLRDCYSKVALYVGIAVPGNCNPTSLKSKYGSLLRHYTNISKFSGNLRFLVSKTGCLSAPMESTVMEGQGYQCSKSLLIKPPGF